MTNRKRELMAGAVATVLLALGSPGAAQAESHGPPVERATGGYHFTIPEELFGVAIGNVFGVSARKYADGIVDGVFHYKQTVLGEEFIFTVRVTCMNLYDGNRAKIGGVIELSNDPTLPPGVFLWFQAIDHGQGQAAPPDVSTSIGAGDEAANEAFCNSDALPRFGPWEVQGNLQVED
jgi:hypothetical protein